MNCRECQNRIDIEFKRGSFELRGELKSHVEGCSNCRSYFGELARLENILDKSSPEVLPDELNDLTFEKIVALAEEKKKPTRIFESIFGFKWVWAPAAAAAIIMATLFIPRIINKSGNFTSNVVAPMADFYGSTDIGLENTLALSDTLTDQFISTMVGSSSDLDQASEELMKGADVDDMINSLSKTELEALYKKLENLKG